MNSNPQKNPAMVVTDEYKKYRKVTFSMPPDKVGCKAVEPKKVYGMNLDVGVYDPVMNTKFAFTTTVFINGEAAFMPTPGGGTMGLGRIPQVAELAKSIVVLGQPLVGQARTADDNPLPDRGMVIFYFLTVTGLYYTSDTLGNIQKNNNAPYSQMLFKFSQIRGYAEKLLDERRK